MRTVSLVLGLAALLGVSCCRGRNGDSAPSPVRSTSDAAAVGRTPESPEYSAPHTPASVPLGADATVVFLHHSTGENIWNGGVPAWLDAYNAKHGKRYAIRELAYPREPYPWDNYPYDYWNIWVKNAGPAPFRGQETLEILTRAHRVIVFKHCYPVTGLEAESGAGEVSSSAKTVGNYKAQYAAIKAKLRTFPNNRFILWTGAVLTRAAMLGEYGGSAETAKRARDFFGWVKNEWDEKGDNIFVFDFYALETDGGNYMLDRYAVGPADPHPNEEFSRQVAPLFAQRVIDVVEGRGDNGPLTGHP